MNGSEKFVSEELAKKGFKVLRRGWPDFLVIDKDGKVHGVGVQSPPDGVSEDQIEMHYHLGKSGIPVSVVKLEQIRSDKDTLWGRACLMEPGITELMEEIRREKSDSDYCANARWYGFFKRKMMKLVGLTSKTGDGFLRSAVIYDTVYRKLYEALPNCGHESERGACVPRHLPLSLCEGKLDDIDE